MVQYSMFDKSCDRILVRGVNWIGDSVMTLPALHSLKKAFPEAHIALLVKSWVAPLFEQNPDINEVIIYENEFQKFWGKFMLSRKIRKGKFCSSILLQNAFDAALIMFLAGIKQRAGYRRDGRGFLLTDSVRVPLNYRETHEIFYYLNLLEHIGIKAEYSVPYLFLSLDERLDARRRLKQLNRPVLGLNPGATFGSAKRWLPERFAEISNWFLKDTHGGVVIFGGQKEIDITDEIFKLIDPRYRADGSVLNIAGKTNLRELISLISECDVFVTNDSGPLHIAYALRTPMVALFGSTDPILTGPPPGIAGNGAEIIKADIPCSPCFERTCKHSDMRCMYSILSDDVFHALQKVLPKRPAVFFDRDGTLCRDTGYPDSFDDLYIFPEIDALTLLKDGGFMLIGMSNQSGIARGLVHREFVEQVNEMFVSKYGFDDFFYCPHHPDEHCQCRKPEPGMLLRARLEYGIDLRKSYVVGDKETDMLLAQAVGARGILVQTGKEKESRAADFVAKDMKDAVEFILAK